MSMTIRYAPVGEGESLPSMTPSRHWQQLGTLFGDAQELTLTLERHEDLVRGALAVADEDEPFWRMLYDALERHGSIRIWRS